MKKFIISGVVLLGILVTCMGLLIKQKKEIVTRSNNSDIVFKATISRTPNPTQQKNEYYVYFNNVETTEKKYQSELEIFNNGGILVAALPAGKTLNLGDEIQVTLHKDFATTHSIPPQIIGNSVIDVSY
ncbi:hypothetical protein [Enterococcus faecalis]|uniref:hypothetical protein n=1 Tax=Enterococcus faecalis TaxID=1351 RepID=UPI0025AFDA91|nr:hypothetical protein [Enterococcus faecalis]MDN3185242.1 hypothetical protein [Enterococcus faecalis]